MTGSSLLVLKLPKMRVFNITEPTFRQQNFMCGDIQYNILYRYHIHFINTVSSGLKKLETFLNESRLNRKVSFVQCCGTEIIQ